MSEVSPDALIARLNQDGEAQLLLDHLQGVAEFAANFAHVFAAGALGGLAGLLHDLGKYRPGFQTYIRQSADAHCEVLEGKKPTSAEKTHSAAGALHLMQQVAALGRPYAWYGKILALLIASHHSGLYDWQKLLERMISQASRQELEESLARAPQVLRTPPLATLPLQRPPGGAEGSHLWMRMMFSALVDADFLDTERFMDPEQFTRRNSFPSLDELKQRFDLYMQTMAQNAKPGAVNQKRAEILQTCRRQAHLPPGVFQLTVPTGGGKTLSSMAFALTHAQQHHQRRIIYAIPYTSIIEQTATVFSQVFGADSFIEHHSNADSGPESETHASRLACENWDAPLVLTTNVQLFESLFAAKTSRCRKLHNIASSILILDEAQLLPPDFLAPIVDCLQLLTRHYGVSVVLCTATQPALEGGANPAFSKFQELPMQKIIADPDALYQAFERVKIHLPPDLHSPRTWEEIAADILRHDCVLSIVNSKKSALALSALLPPDTLHLSAHMCGRHRSEVITAIRQRLQARREGRDHMPLRVVSTQLIEAGVDLDFPVVFRALAGLDSIAQAAGRCNREGRLELGHVYVFVPPIAPPPGLLALGAGVCRTVLHGAPAKPLTPSLFTRYFEELYQHAKLDREQILPALRAKDVDGMPAPQFRSVAARFKLIDDKEMACVVVRWREADELESESEQLLRILQVQGPQRWLMRKLQRHTVNIYRNQAERLLRQGDIQELFPGLYVQTHDMLYDERFGIRVDAMPGEAADYVV